MRSPDRRGRFQMDCGQLQRSGKPPRILQASWWTRAYGALLLCAATAIALPAQTFTTLASFEGTNGANPKGPLVQGADGNFWATTNWRGPNSFGTVFKVDATGTVTTVYSFCTQLNCQDGEDPLAGLALDTTGNLYGTTQSGGANGSGIVFKVTPSGTLSVLHSFDSSDAEPVAPLVLGPDADFYGTTLGTAFKITLDGTFGSLGDLSGASGAALVRGPDGNYYGTTGGGGGNGYGAVYKVTPGGTLTTLYSFENSADGAHPWAGIVQARDGNFYGATYDGAKTPYGTIFRITPDGMLTTLFTFPADGSQGGNCENPLTPATDGNLYGMAYQGGANAVGTIFRITLSGALTTLHSFDGMDGGGNGSLVQGTDGKFYGVTVSGGRGGWGTVFSLDTGLSPFVQPVPSFGKVGQQIMVLGTNLTGTTSVSFNGTPATFTVVSGTLIKATIPAGATSGFVTVVTPNGTLESNLPFRAR